MTYLNGNYIDLLIIVVLGFYVLDGLKRGFWILLGELFSFLGAMVIAFRLYPFVGQFFIANFNIPHSFSNALGFIVVAIAAQTLINIGVDKLLTYLPRRFWEARWAGFLSVVPAFLDAAVLATGVLTVIVSAPISPKVKNDIVTSRIGGYLVSQGSGLETRLSEVFGGAIRDSLTFLTVTPESGERVEIPYKPKKLTVDEVSEARMLELVNRERAKVGAKQLTLDPTIVSVARAHSRDMWERGYFSHTNPDGLSPFDRMERGGVKFIAAGENLALAPNVQMAHQGLMNSPGHRRNILDPQFGRIGVGVVDGGIYGKMFTQNFAD